MKLEEDEIIDKDDNVVGLYDIESKTAIMEAELEDSEKIALRKLLGNEAEITYREPINNTKVTKKKAAKKKVAQKEEASTPPPMGPHGDKGDAYVKWLHENDFDLFQATYGLDSSEEKRPIDTVRREERSDSRYAGTRNTILTRKTRNPQ